ncbi:unnamed protein product [Ascophyllum nodosum]
MQTIAANGVLEEFYFFNQMVEGDGDVLLLEEGPFKLTASCQTVNYTYSDYNDDYYGGSSTFSYSFSDDYWSNYVYSDSIAALELTFTASDSDYLFGSPTYTQFPFEERIVGSYEAGESRTQIILAGYDGGYSTDSTLQSLSGSYITTNGANTIGAHRKSTRWYPYNEESTFPEGIDCLVAGVISYTPS